MQATLYKVEATSTALCVEFSFVFNTQVLPTFSRNGSCLAQHGLQSGIASGGSLVSLRDQQVPEISTFLLAPGLSQVLLNCLSGLRACFLVVTACCPGNIAAVSNMRCISAVHYLYCTDLNAWPIKLCCPYEKAPGCSKCLIRPVTAGLM